MPDSDFVHVPSNHCNQSLRAISSDAHFCPESVRGHAANEWSAGYSTNEHSRMLVPYIHCSGLYEETNSPKRYPLEGSTGELYTGKPLPAEAEGAQASAGNGSTLAIDCNNLAQIIGDPSLQGGFN